MNLDPEKWPEVPKADRPKRLPVNENVTENVKSALSSKGWNVIDVRLLNESDKFDAVLEGVWLNTITLTEQLEAVIDFELKLRSKDLKNEKQDESFTGNATVDTLMSFGKKHAEAGEKPPTTNGRKRKYK